MFDFSYTFTHIFFTHHLDMDIALHPSEDILVFSLHICGDLGLQLLQVNKSFK